MITSDALQAAVAAAVLLASTGAQAAETPPALEKCYGVAKAGKNDCQTASSSCAGSSRVDRQPDAWIYLPTGTCAKLAGGSTTPGPVAD